MSTRLGKERRDLRGEARADALDLGDLVRGRGAQAVEAAELLEERGATGRPEAGHVLEDAFADLPRAQVGVVGVGEAVRLVAQPLQQLQPGMCEGQPQRLAGVGEEDRLLLLRQADQRGRLAVERASPSDSLISVCVRPAGCAWSSRRMSTAGVST